MEDCNNEIQSTEILEEYQIMSVQDIDGYFTDNSEKKLILMPITDEKELIELTMIPMEEEFPTPDTPPSVSDEDLTDRLYFPIVQENGKRMANKSTKQKRRHACTVCDRRFVRPAELRRHETTHTNKREFTCGICNQQFKRNDHYRSHFKSRHSDTKQECHFCDYKTARKDTLKRHIACRHTPKRSIE